VSFDQQHLIIIVGENINNGGEQAVMNKQICL